MQDIAKMVKGDVVVCTACPDGGFTVGKEYTVLACRGDDDTACGGLVSGEGMILQADSGEHTYCCYPECCFGKWRLVQQDAASE